jgi:hypothetical protein
VGDTWVIDSGMYFDAAKKCQSLASDISLALGPLQRALVHDCGGMAGDHEKSEQWTTIYDQNARDIVTLAATLCNALQRFGDVLAANGYNWWQSNRATTSGAEPTRPTQSEPLYDSGMALPTTAKGANGAGIDTSITGLLEQVGKIPNGDSPSSVSRRVPGKHLPTTPTSPEPRTASTASSSPTQPELRSRCDSISTRNSARDGAR